MKKPVVIKKIEHGDLAFNVLLMDNTRTKDVDLFFQSYYESFGLRPSLDKKWFNWFYTKSPDGVCNNYILVDVAAMRWIGGFGFAKKRYCMKGQIRCGRLGVNGFINSGYEGRGLYTSLIRTVMNNEIESEDIAFSFPHASNIGSVKGHLKNGWRNAIKLLFLNIGVSGDELDVPCVTISETLEPVVRLDFESISRHKDFYFIRSVEYLRWRFYERPDKNYTFLFFENGSVTEGYLILAKYRSKQGITRFQIADFAFTRPEILSKLVDKARYLAATDGCDVLDVLINPMGASTRLFHEKGFVQTSEGYEMLTYSQVPFSIPPDAEATFADFDVV